MNGFHVHRADFAALFTLITASFLKLSLQDVATIASIFAFTATGIYYVYGVFKMSKSKKEPD